MMMRILIPRVLTPGLVAVLIASLAGCSPDSKESSVPDAASAASAEESGARIYSGNCVPCHQANGQGIPNLYPSLAGSPVVLGDPRELVLWVVKNQRPASMPAGRFPSVMPSFGWLKDADAAAITSFVRSHFGNDAPPVDAATVASALGR